MPKVQKPKTIDNETNEILIDDNSLVDLESAEAQLPVTSSETERVWPKPPGKTLTFEQLCEYMGSFNTLQWSHAMVYLYRFWPIIYRDPKYIDVITEAKQLDLEYIISQFGGGKYKLLVTDTDRKDSKQVCEAYLKISHIEHEPILNYDEVDKGHRDNRTYVERLIAKGILDQGGNTVSSQTKPIQGGNDLTVLASTMQSVVNQLLSERRQGNTNKTGIDEAVITRSLDMMSGAYKTALDTAVKQGNPNEVDQLTKIMSTFQTIMQMVKPDANANRQSDTLWEKILSMQSENHKVQLEVMKELLKNNQAAKNPDSQLDGLLGLLGKMKEIFGLDTISGSSHKPSTLETIMEKAPLVLDPLARIAENVYNGLLMRKGMSGVSQPIRQPANAAINPQALSAGDQPNRGVEMNPGNPTVNATENIDSELGFDPVAFVNQYGPIILQWINSNKTGDELAEWVESGFGSTTYLAIRNIGKEKMLRAMKMVPEYWQLIQPIEQQVSVFIDEFIGYADMPIEGDGEKETVQ